VPDRLSAARQSGERLRNTPVAMELPVKVNHTYFNTPSGRELLSKDSPNISATSLCTSEMPLASGALENDLRF
jgi:hypothetical protein